MAPYYIELCPCREAGTRYTSRHSVAISANLTPRIALSPWWPDDTAYQQHLFDLPCESVLKYHYATRSSLLVLLRCSNLRTCIHFINKLGLFASIVFKVNSVHFYVLSITLHWPYLLMSDCYNINPTII